jgi:hypothetical protein
VRPLNSNVKWRNEWYVIKRYVDVHHGQDWGYWAVVYGGSDKAATDNYKARLDAENQETMVVGARALTATLMLLNG